MTPTNNKPTFAPQAFAAQKYAAARSNLLLMIALTAVNIFLLFVEADVFLLFSATAPYMAVTLGMLSEATPLTIAGICAAVFMLAAYLICWLLSKKHFGWMIAALAMFAVDTLLMIGFYLIAEDFSGILDVIIHAWVLYYLITGVRYGYQLRTLPPDPDYSQTPPVVTPETTAGDTPFLRIAEASSKARPLLEADVEGYHICYRRIKRINELVINGYVYADMEALMETAHVLEARVGGLLFQVGYDGFVQSYLRVNGETIMKKPRVW